MRRRRFVRRAEGEPRGGADDDWTWRSVQIAGGKHMNLHPGFAQDAILGARFRFHFQRENIPNPAAGRPLLLGDRAAFNGRRIEVATRHISI
jgi:hypothetical protein